MTQLGSYAKICSILNLYTPSMHNIRSWLTDAHMGSEDWTRATVAQIFK